MRIRLTTMFLAIAMAWISVPSAKAIDVVGLTAQQIQIDYAAGTYTATDLVNAYINRIDKYESTYNAFTSLEFADALARAAEIDAVLATTGSKGPLYGVPVVVKDNMDWAGKITTNGYFGFSAATGGVDLIPSLDSSVVRRLEAAGAIILGKTNLPDFARSGTDTNSSGFGQTFNGYGLDQGKKFFPGGSSGGTATAVNLSMGVLGLGTETGGSIQNPSSAQGLVGIKPTFGLVPTDGIFPLNATLRDVAGPMAKSVYDAAATLDVIAGPSGRDPKTADAIGNLPGVSYTTFLDAGSLAGKRVGVYEPIWNAALEPEVAALYASAMSTVESLGATLVTEVFEGTGWATLFSNPPVAGGVFKYDINQYLAQLGPTTSFDSIESFAAVAGFPMGQGANPGNVINAVNNSISGDIFENAAFQALYDWQNDVLALYQQIMIDKDLDALIYPFSFRPLPEIGGPGLGAVTVNEINVAGLPVLTVPVDYFDSGAPFHLVIVGNDKWTEPEIISYGYALETAFDARIEPTAVPEAGTLILVGSACLVSLVPLVRRRTKPAVGTISA
jgi:Asp-tRNA(Asn)/Glu-tRNA(Gln) amidotransferase A subunit family amidase